MYRKISAFLFIALMFFSISQDRGNAVFAQQQDAVVSPPENAVKEKEPDGQKSAAPEQPGQAVQMSDIHDLKPPEEAGFDPTTLYYALAAVLILAILTALFIYLKKRSKKINDLQNRSTLPPDELAFTLLDGLLDVDAFDGKVFYFRLSAILRGYIQGRYGINAPEMTTEELLPAMDKSDIPKELQKNVRELLHSSDPVKFAGSPAVQSKMHNDLMFVRNFVKQTKAEEITKA